MEWPCPRDPIKVVNVFAAVTVAKSLLPLLMSQPALVKWRFPSPGSSLGSRSHLPAIFGRRAIFSPPGCCVSGARSTCRPWRRPGWVSSRCVVAAGCAASGRWRALQLTMNLQIQRRHISVNFLYKNWYTIFTARQQSCGKVMFSLASACLFTWREGGSPCDY